MPGFELIDEKERHNIENIFDESNGVLFAHGFDGLRNGRFRVREFENQFSKKINVDYTLAVTSGTIAQYIAMKAYGIGPGDEVITQSFTFVATVESIIALGATPIIIDIDETYNIDPNLIEKHITSKTKLIVPVHMLGNPAEMDAINLIAAKHKIPVLEDGCEALGAKYKGNYIGSLSDSAVFSLDFAKTITCGEGGLITTNNFDLWKYSKEFHDHGHESNPKLPRGNDSRTIPGLNFRITEMQAAVASAQLKKLDYIVCQNKKNKSILKNIISDDDRIKFRRITDEKGELADTLIFNFEDVEFNKKFVSKLNEKSIITKNIPDAIDWHFSGTWNHMFKDVPIYRDTWNKDWKYSRDLLNRSVALPIFVKKSEKEMYDLGKSILKILKDL